MIDFKKIEESLILRRERKDIKKFCGLKKIFNRYISESKKHLDFGCGFGCKTYLIACEYPKIKIIGMDKDRNIIRLAKKRYKTDNLKFMVSGCVKGKFDSISCFNVLHHIKDVKEYVKGFYSHLNAKGIVIVSDFRRVPKKKFRKLYYNKRLREYRKIKSKVLSKIFKPKSFEEDYKQHCRWNIKQFVSMFEEAGFKTLDIIYDELNLFYLGIKR